MGQNKQGIQILEDEQLLIIKAKDDFSQKASLNNEILAKLASGHGKRIRIHLSSKTKNFQSILFKIRQEVIKQNLEDVKITVNTHPCFRQKIDASNNLKCIQTPHYVLNCDDNFVCVHMAYKEKVHAYDLLAREIMSTIAHDKAQNVEVHFTISEQEKESEYHKRIKDLEKFFTACAITVYGINRVDFYAKARPEPRLIGFYERGKNNGIFYELVPPPPPSRMVGKALSKYQRKSARYHRQRTYE